MDWIWTASISRYGLNRLNMDCKYIYVWTEYLKMDWKYIYIWTEYGLQVYLWMDWKWTACKSTYGLDNAWLLARFNCPPEKFRNTVFTSCWCFKNCHCFMNCYYFMKCWCFTNCHHWKKGKKGASYHYTQVILVFVLFFGHNSKCDVCFWNHVFVLIMAFNF